VDYKGLVQFYSVLFFWGGAGTVEDPVGNQPPKLPERRQHWIRVWGLGFGGLGLGLVVGCLCIVYYGLRIMAYGLWIVD